MARPERRYGGITLGGIIVIVGLILIFIWCFWIGLIVALTLALRQGATRVANVFTAVCPKICLVSGWMAPRDTDTTLTAKFRNAIQAASVWADQEKNRRASDAILSRYTPIDPAVMGTMTRAYYAQRLVPRLAQPWIDAYAEFGVIPESFPAIQLVK